MLVTHTFLDKTNTIYRDENKNTGLSPICSLYYGKINSRVLLYFDLNKIKKMIDDKTYPDIKKLHHKLKMFNCADLQIDNINIPFRPTMSERTQSFDLILTKLPNYWDNGRGFDYVEDNYIDGEPVTSIAGSNWYKSENIVNWEIPGAVDIENEDNVIYREHFEYGNENIDFDITEYVNDCLNCNTENFGLMLSFDDAYEKQKLEVSQYVGFYSAKTNSFFQPFLETTYDEKIEDNRANFILGKTNKLYFYAIVGSQMVNLDKLPKVNINGSLKSAKQATKGIYYVDVDYKELNLEPNTMYFDKWSNLSYNGEEIEDVELYFTPKKEKGYLNFGLPYETVKLPQFSIYVSGIKDMEKIPQFDIRKLLVDCKIDYTSSQNFNPNKIYYRIYTTVANKEVVVYDWNEIDKVYNSNEILINTKELLPAKYYIDISVEYGNEKKIKEKILEFEITSNYLK